MVKAPLEVKLGTMYSMLCAYSLARHCPSTAWDRLGVTRGLSFYLLGNNINDSLQLSGYHQVKHRTRLRPVTY